jgi:RNA polymerase sigma factor (sigma-70 family)
MASQCQTSESFTRFMEQSEPRVRRALVSSFGSRFGRDATLDAFEYAWEHWDRVQTSANPAGYVYKTGVHCAARARRKEGRKAGFDVPQAKSEPWIEPKLEGALDRLTRPQRTTVVLIYGFGWTYQEVSELLDIRRSTVQRHVARAMKRLRLELGVHDAVA